MVRHQAVRMADPLIPLDNLGQNLQEGLTIGSREEDPLSCIAPRGDVIDSSFVLNPQCSCQRRTSTQGEERPKT